VSLKRVLISRNIIDIDLISIKTHKNPARNCGVFCFWFYRIYSTNLNAEVQTLLAIK